MAESRRRARRWRVVVLCAPLAALVIVGCEAPTPSQRAPTAERQVGAAALEPASAEGAARAGTAEQVLRRLGALTLATDGGDAALVLQPGASPMGAAAPRKLLPPASPVPIERLDQRLRPVASELASAELELPARADRPFLLRDRRSGLSIEVATTTARAAAGELRDGYVVYAGALGDGTHVVHRPHLDGTEDYVWYERAPTNAELAYDVTLGAGVAAVRLVQNTLLLLDAQGQARLRMAPPYLVDARGARRELQVRVSGCRLDQGAGELRDPGAGPCRVQLALAEAESLAYPIVIDPSWTTTAAMASARADHGAVLLTTGPNAGKVLVLGGYLTTGLVTNTVELYDPATPAWTPAPPMAQARQAPSAVVLGDGRVLVAGGYASGSLASAELYDPVMNTWSAAASMGSKRLWTPATLLTDGRVLIAGGHTGGPLPGTPITVLQSAEVYNPTSNSWAPTPTMASARGGLTATRLANGKVLVAGGSNGTFVLMTAQVYDPAANSWASTGAPAEAHEWATANLLPNGRVLLAGGWDGAAASSVAELYDPASNAWTGTGALVGARWSHASAVLYDGRILVASGSATNDAPLGTGAVYDPGTAQWAATPALQFAHGGGSTATALPSSKVLLAGGAPRTTGIPMTRSELYEPRLSNGVACSSAAQCISGNCVDGVCCDLACGGGVASDCQACSVAAGAVTNGSCAPRASGRSCRPSAGFCDVAEACNGTATSCPPDAFAAATIECRAAAGVCDVAEHCNGSAALCPADAVSPATTPCRAAAGVCDVAENCDGTSVQCPGDGFMPSSVTCRGPVGVCDAPETCSGSGVACPSDAKLPATSVCRAASGGCDVAESCDGVSNACGADAVRPGAFLCRAVAGQCDLAEICNGTSKACPADGFVASGTQCRAVVGPCDLVETCTGAGAACPVDVRRPAGFVCRAAGGMCDLVETCDGAAATCPGDKLVAAGGVCRAGTGPCDATERCAGNTVQCPGDALEPAGTSCRAVAGLCDVAELCTGSATGCGADQAQAPGTPCGAPPEDVCDAQDVCAGSVGATATCVPAFASSATACRAASCSSDTATLPANCDGAGACPAPTLQSCGDYLCDVTADVCATDCLSDPALCADAAHCSAGVCVPDVGLGESCVSDDECTSGFCIDGMCCDGDCPGACDDGICEVPEMDAGVIADAGADAGAIIEDATVPGVDAAVGRDAAVVEDGSVAEKPDTGPAPGTELTGGGCGCRVTGPAAPVSGRWLAVLLVAAVVRVRRRR